jgi:hypothetical protein
MYNEHHEFIVRIAGNWASFWFLRCYVRWRALGRLRVISSGFEYYRAEFERYGACTDQRQCFVEGLLLAISRCLGMDDMDVFRCNIYHTCKIHTPSLECLHSEIF